VIIFFSLAENDLLVEVLSFFAFVGLFKRLFKDVSAEFVKGLGDGLVLRAAVLFCSSDFVLGSGALALHKQLSEVLGLAVGGSPLPVLRLERILRLSSLLSGWLLSRWLLPLSNWFRLFLLSRRLFDLELFPLDIILLDVLLLAVELEPDDGLHLADVSLDGEELIHETQFHLVFGAGQARRVAQTLDQDVTLRGLAVQGDRVLQKGDYCVRVEVGCGKLLLTELVLGLCLNQHSSRFLGSK